MNWVRPRKPNAPTTGRVVINTDDGDYRVWYYWFPLFVKKAYEHSQWVTRGKPSVAVFNPAVNPYYLGSLNAQGNLCLTADQIKYMYDCGFEICSHGHKHVYLSDYAIAQALTTGNTRVYHNAFDAPYAYAVGYTYTIKEGEAEEIVTVEAVGDDGTPYFDITAPITNNYTTAARIYPTEDTIIKEFNRSIIDLDALGITCKNHVGAFYNLNATAKALAKNYFDSSTQASGAITDVLLIDLYDIKRTDDISTLTQGDIDTILDEVQQLDTVVFIQGHNSPTDAVLNLLEYLIDQCLTRGVRIVNQADAVDFIKSQQAS